MKTPMPNSASTTRTPRPLLHLAAALAGIGFAGLATGALMGAQREFNEEQLQNMLKRWPDADANKDGKLTPDEFREFRSRHRSAAGAASARPSPAATIAAPTSALPRLAGTQQAVRIARLDQGEQPPYGSNSSISQKNASCA